VLQADFVAFSAGAYKAVAIALRGRVAATRLALVSPVIGFDPEVAQRYRDVAAAARSGAFDPRPTWLERMTSPGFAERDPPGAARVLAWLDAVPLSVLCDELVAAADAPDLRSRLRELACRLLVCAGTHDNAVPLAWSRDVAACAQRGSLECVDGAGHALLVEAPEHMSRAIGDFLA
jgi:pimeloyl-ACP methyl ester carboxylesterase